MEYSKTKWIGNQILQGGSLSSGSVIMIAAKETAVRRTQGVKAKVKSWVILQSSKNMPIEILFAHSDPPSRGLPLVPPSNSLGRSDCKVPSKIFFFTMHNKRKRQKNNIFKKQSHNPNQAGQSSTSYHEADDSLLRIFQKEKTWTPPKTCGFFPSGVWDPISVRSYGGAEQSPGLWPEAVWT